MIQFYLSSKGINPHHSYPKIQLHHIKKPSTSEIPFL
nr:MAG TPA: hypothetical protein [Caudoviricetes sp.]